MFNKKYKEHIKYLISELKDRNFEIKTITKQRDDNYENSLKFETALIKANQQIDELKKVNKGLKIAIAKRKNNKLKVEGVNE